MRREFKALVASTVAIGGLSFAGAAFAGLGENVDSVARDHAALRARSAGVTPMQAYDLHEMVTADGGRVREYVSRGGTVFAVTFSGRSMPDLRAVLGAHFADYSAAVNSRRTNHKVLSLNEPGLVLKIVKLPRGMAGSAHVPALLPSGVAVQDLR